jgi:DHA2 family multidrug resistance protein-like MFS transporter
VAWRLALSGAGFGLFQAPNNRLLIGSAPADRAGAGSGMLSTSRLVGQTTGSALVAVVLGLTDGGSNAAGAHGIVQAAHVSLALAAGFAATAMGLSWLRVLPR